MKTRLVNWLFFVIVVLAVQSCASPQKMLDQGNYDELIDLATRKLAGKKNKKAEYVQALEVAFEQVTSQDMARANRLRLEDRPEDWPRIYDIYLAIDRRQNQIRPFLPLVDEEGIKANFRFVKVDGLLTEAREKAAAYHYDIAQQHLRRAQDEDDPFAARDAYGELERIERYYRTYREKDRLQNLALELGQSHILITVENNAPTVLPRQLEEEIKRFGVQDMQSRWQVYHTEFREDVPFDYKIVMNLQAIDIGPSIVRERSYEESKEIKDGFEYVLDERGNVRKDSLGNDIKVDRFVQVYAEVLETHQEKVAGITGQLEFYDLRRRALLGIQPLAAEAIFENYAATFRGDRRALSKESRSRIGNTPLPFPSDETMLYDAVTHLKPVMKQTIKRTQLII